MVMVLAHNWWTLIARGVLAILFGLAAIVWPGITLVALVLLFAAYALIDGIFALVAGLAGANQNSRWWALVLEGIVGIAAAAATVAWPGLSALVLVYLIAAWAIITGVLELAASVRLRREMHGEWLLALSGVISVLFGVYAALFPGLGALTIVWIIGTYAVIWGVLLIALGIKLRGHQERIAVQPTQAAGTR